MYSAGLKYEKSTHAYVIIKEILCKWISAEVDLLPSLGPTVLMVEPEALL